MTHASVVASVEERGAALQSDQLQQQLEQLDNNYNHLCNTAKVKHTLHTACYSTHVLLLTDEESL